MCAEQRQRFDALTDVMMTPLFCFQNSNPWARVISIHDGDTIGVIMEVMPSYFFRVSVRLRDIDACELRDTDPLKKTKAQTARRRLIQLICGEEISEQLVQCRSSQQQRLALCQLPSVMVRLENLGHDKYGRVLATVFASDDDQNSVNDRLLAEGVVESY